MKPLGRKPSRNLPSSAPEAIVLRTRRLLIPCWVSAPVVSLKDDRRPNNTALILIWIST